MLGTNNIIINCPLNRTEKQINTLQRMNEINNEVVSHVVVTCEVFQSKEMNIRHGTSPFFTHEYCSDNFEKYSPSGELPGIVEVLLDTSL